MPVTQLDLISKYIGPSENSAVKINRLGSGDWQKAKARVRRNVKDIAAELTRLYAERMAAPGHAFPPDGEWQRDFEASFEYEETDDQLRCIDEIKSDMERTAPMDRLLCGDVGFGKPRWRSGRRLSALRIQNNAFCSAPPPYLPGSIIKRH